MPNDDYIRGFSEGYEEFAEKVVIRMVIEFMRKLKELANGSDKTYALLCEVTAATFAAHGLLEEFDIATPDVTDELTKLIEDLKND